MVGLAALIINLYMCKDDTLLYFLKNYQLLACIIFLGVSSFLELK